MKPINYLIPFFALSLLLSACSNTQNTPPISNPNGNGNQHGNQGGQQGGGSGHHGQGSGNTNANSGNGGVNGANAALLKQRIIYFAYNSSQITTEGIDILAAHSQYLAAHPNKRVRLEGHADERGSREYNIALSLDRAVAVEEVLKIKGANADTRAIPYGEEMPVALGHTSSAWDKNRRVEIVY